MKAEWGEKNAIKSVFEFINLSRIYRREPTATIPLIKLEWIIDADWCFYCTVNTLMRAFEMLAHDARDP